MRTRDQAVARLRVPTIDLNKTGIPSTIFERWYRSCSTVVIRDISRRARSKQHLYGVHMRLCGSCYRASVTKTSLMHTLSEDLHVMWRNRKVPRENEQRLDELYQERWC